jgi:hypothetical protein
VFDEKADGAALVLGARPCAAETRNVGNAATDALFSANKIKRVKNLKLLTLSLAAQTRPIGYDGPQDTGSPVALKLQITE